LAELVRLEERIKALIPLGLIVVFDEGNKQLKERYFL
jgi:hypothetical protein